jgi:hypothetical protein
MNCDENCDQQSPESITPDTFEADACNDPCERFLPRTPIPFDRFRAELASMGLLEEPCDDLCSDHVDFTDGVVSICAVRTYQGTTIFVQDVGAPGRLRHNG